MAETGAFTAWQGIWSKVFAVHVTHNADLESPQADRTSSTVSVVTAIFGCSGGASWHVCILKRNMTLLRSNAYAMKTLLLLLAVD